MARKLFTMIGLMLLSFTAYSQAGSTVLITISNFVQTNANTFEYDVFMTNNGPVNYAISGYSWGLNMTPGIANGGTISHVFLCRDAIFNPIPPVTSAYTPSQYHLRGTTVNVASGNEVIILPGVAYRLARMRVQTTAASWAVNANPFIPVFPVTPIQVVFAPGKTQGVITAVLSPGSPTYSINGLANTPSGTSVQGLTAIMIPDP
ncbi:hypothetical protein EMGBS15_13310 [Filimonas sp.]|nr:hypothetical protein EMGBS15_13310 [Filimonas sp.]